MNTDMRLFQGISAMIWESMKTFQLQRSIEEDQTNEQTDLNAESSLGVDVRRRAPVLLEDTLSGNLELLEERSCKLAVRFRVVVGRRVGIALGLETLKLILNVLILGALSPGLMPVGVSMRAWCSTNDLEHPFSRVLALGARIGTILLEEEEPVEALEQHSGRLVNGTENRLACLGELLEKIEDSPGCLRIKTGGGFVDKEEKGRLGGELNTDCKTLALFNIETLAEDTYDGVGVLLHIEQLDDFVNVSNLFITQCGSGLSKKGAESQGLTNGAGLQVEILLLRESARLDPTVYIIENTARFALDLDIVAHIVPVEDAGRPLNVGVLVVELFGGGNGTGRSSLRIGLALGHSCGNVAVTEYEDFAL
ncbi:hypothetical protein HG530_000375 [Fusarium avenaceum]|nr:hypothetical protein HG530_000375 [Fusarium avenaceum]